MGRVDIDMKSKKLRRKLCAFAAVSTATCFAFGAGCIEAVLASIGATFF